MNQILREQISKLARKKQTAVTLSDLYKYSRANTDQQRIYNARFLQRELPIRFAQRVEQLGSLPHGMSAQRNIIALRDIYARICGDIGAMPAAASMDDAHRFSHRLGEILERKNAASVVQTMALAVLQLRRNMDGEGLWDPGKRRAVDSALDSFYMSRIGMRFIIEQFVASGEQMENTQLGGERYAGVIDGAMDPGVVARLAAEDAAALCAHHFDRSAPDVTIVADEGATFTFVPAHLHYILLELLKNAMRATVERHGRAGDDYCALPDIKVVISVGDEDVCVKVADEGGGIPRSEVPLLWTYLHSTAPRPSSIGLDVGSMQMGAMAEGLQGSHAPLAGFGVGLPLSRLYAQYFGGDLDIKSMDGYGTDCYVFLNRLGTECENLPSAVQTSPGERLSQPDQGEEPEEEDQRRPFGL
jgi:pyruvate dehydrogenase kinase 2/3/4